MTPDEMRAALTELGWKQADFWRRAGLDKNTPSRWLSGATPIPEWVGAYLGVMLDVQRLHAKYVQPTPSGD
jgi:hypothetical protein